jgi:hypothetical protein
MFARVFDESGDLDTREVASVGEAIGWARERWNPRCVGLEVDAKGVDFVENNGLRFQVHVWFGAEGDARVSESFETREKADEFAAYYAAEWAGEATAIFAGGRRLDVSAG